MRYYVDSEFDGHGGALLSMALVREDGASLYVVTTEDAADPWVRENVLSKIAARNPDAFVSTDYVGAEVSRFLNGDTAPIIIADSPVDIGRFCEAISTAPGGGYAPCIAPSLAFEVHDRDCYPTALNGAVQHNAWWDAMALRHLLTQEPSQ